MARKSNAQVNIRSEFVRSRVRELAAETGKSATQVVEDAVRAYKPPPPDEDDLPEGMMRVGWLVVRKSDGNGRVITLEDTNRAIEEDRNRDLWADYED